MKLMRTTISLALAVVLAGGAFAQTNNRNIPGPADYAAFTRFITDRNIFDPSRVPHNFPGTFQRRTQRPHPSPSTPAITLVGTMSYEKGYFAFFNGNNEDFRQILQVSQKIAGYTVTDITPGQAQLESTDKKKKLQLKVGDILRQENGSWQLSGSSEIPAGDVSETSSVLTTTSATADAGSTTSATSTPPSASEPNDILKRLMQRKEQETK
jgi:hypothetical protein